MRAPERPATPAAFEPGGSGTNLEARTRSPRESGSRRALSSRARGAGPGVRGRARRDVARALLRAGVDPNLAWARDGFAPCCVSPRRAGASAWARKMAVVERSRRGADARAATGTNAAHLAAARGERALLELLLVRGCDPGAADGDKQTVAHLAARCGARLARRDERWRARRCARGKAGSSRGTRGAAPPRTGPWRTARPTRCSRCGTPAHACARLARRVGGGGDARVQSSGRQRAEDGERATDVLAALVAGDARFSVSTRARIDEALEDTELLNVTKSGIRDDVPERSTRAIEAEIVAAGRAAATLKELVCANAFVAATRRAGSAR